MVAMVIYMAPAICVIASIVAALRLQNCVCSTYYCVISDHGSVNSKFDDQFHFQSSCVSELHGRYL